MKSKSLLARQLFLPAFIIFVVLFISSHRAPSISSAPRATKISSFSPIHAARQAIVEDQLKKHISAEEIRKQHRYFTSMPHPAGSVHNHEVAEYIAEQWRKQGLEDVIIRQYDVLGTKPVSTSLAMVAPTHYQALLREAAYDVDPDTKNPEVANAWLGYSASGEVTAPVVYAHSVNPEDYDLLRKNGIDAKGKIVLVRNALASGKIADDNAIDRFNQEILRVESNWLHTGIPGRPWFKHLLNGARYTYAHLELPGLTEAVEAQDEAQRQAEILGQAIDTNTALMRRMEKELQQ